MGFVLILLGAMCIGTADAAASTRNLFRREVSPRASGQELKSDDSTQGHKELHDELNEMLLTALETDDIEDSDLFIETCTKYFKELVGVHETWSLMRSIKLPVFKREKKLRPKIRRGVVTERPPIIVVDMARMTARSQKIAAALAKPVHGGQAGVFFPQSQFGVVENIPGRYYYSRGFTPCVAFVAFSESHVFLAHFDEKNKARQIIMEGLKGKMGNTKIHAFTGFGTRPDSPLIQFEIISAVSEIKENGNDDIDLHLFDSKVNPHTKCETSDLVFAPAWPQESQQAHTERIHDLFGTGITSTFVMKVPDMAISIPDVTPVALNPCLVHDPPIWSVKVGSIQHPKEGVYVSEGLVAKKIDGTTWIWTDPHKQ